MKLIQVEYTETRRTRATFMVADDAPTEWTGDTVTDDAITDQIVDLIANRNPVAFNTGFTGYIVTDIAPR